VSAETPRVTFELLLSSEEYASSEEAIKLMLEVHFPGFRVINDGNIVLKSSSGLLD
jgi:ATP-dependent Clp protease adapter protein ClpS